jgi:hypothetical protein
MTLEQHPALDELVLYGIGTADADTRERVRPHLSECAQCRAEIERIHTELALTAMVSSEIAPPLAAKERQFKAAGLNLPESEKRVVRPAAAIPSDAPPVQATVVSTRRTSLVLAWIGWAAAVACVFYAVHVRNGSNALRRQTRAQDARIVQLEGSTQRARQVMDLLSSPRAQRVTLTAAHARPEPSGHAVYLADQGALVFTASNLAPLPANKTYELWVIPASGAASPVPAGIFRPDARGMASVLLPHLPKGVQARAFGVTMEKTGGADKPTLPILLVGTAKPS